MPRSDDQQKGPQSTMGELRFTGEIFEVPIKGDNNNGGLRFTGEIFFRSPCKTLRLVVSHAGFEGESELLQEMYERGLKLPEVGTDLHAGDGMLMFWSHVPIAPWQTPEWLERCPLAAGPSPSLSASCAQAEKSLEHSVEQKSYSFANLAPQTRHIRHRLSCASVPPDFIDQKEKGISDQSEGEIDENSVFHCFPHKLVRGLA